MQGFKASGENEPESYQPEKKEERHEREEQFVFESGLHDLKNLLTASLACVQSAAMRLDTSDPEGAKRFLEVALKQHFAMSESASALLTYTRLGEGGIPLKREAWPVKPLVEHAVRLFGGVAALNKVEIQTEFAGLLPLLRVDGQIYVRILINLFMNAVRHLGERRSLWVSVCPEGKTLVVTRVKDEGEGIDPQAMKRLFEKKVPHFESGGHGVGLYLCRVFVEKLGGTIWAESEPGKGTTFSFTVPVS